jgi:hypothetical protein
MIRLLNQSITDVSITYQTDNYLTIKSLMTFLLVNSVRLCNRERTVMIQLVSWQL